MTELYCPNIYLSCPKYPYRCCYNCPEQKTCDFDLRCDTERSAKEVKGKGFTPVCRDKYGLTFEELVYALILDEDSIDKMLERKHHEYEVSHAET